MRATRRRARTLHPLASLAAVRSVCDRLRLQMVDVIPKNEKQMVLFLYSVRHIERWPASETKRGRPSRWRREDLLQAASYLRGILARETNGRVSLSSFIGQHLQVLRFPTDVCRALEDGSINLQEASQLARLTPERLSCSPAEARVRRTELLSSHLAMHGSQPRLRARVKEILGEATAEEVTSEQMAHVVARVDEMLDVDPHDTRHLFWEEMKTVFFAMRDVQPEDLDDALMSDFLASVDNLSNVLHRIEKRRREREKLKSIAATA